MYSASYGIIYKEVVSASLQLVIDCPRYQPIMSRIVLVLFAVLAVFSASSSGQQCGLNEEFNSCGSACEPSCATPKIDFCTYQCVIGCQCKSGYLRNGGGTCVRQEDC